MNIVDQSTSWLRREGIWLLLVVAVAAFLRLFHLGTLPYGFHNDEVMNGYVGRFIFENGRDLYGNRWPILYFNNFGDYPNVVPMYLSGLFTYVFGVTEFGVRFPIALAGTLTVGVVYLICRWLFASRWVAVLAALLLALLPWHVVLSRATAEGITASFVYLTGFFIVFRAVEARRTAHFFIGLCCLLLTYLLYPGFRILTPLSFSVVVLLAVDRSWRIGMATVFALLLLLAGLISQTTWGKGRFEQTSIFTHNNVIGGKALQYATGLGENKILQAKVFHNKVVLAGQEIARQYASYFSPQFLLGSAGKPARYAIPEQGLVYYSLVLVMLGSLLLQVLQPYSRAELLGLFNKGRARYFLAFGWLAALSPISAALTLEDVPNVHRSVQLSALLVIVAAGALAMLHKKLRSDLSRAAFTTVFMLVLVSEAVFFWHYFAGLSAMTSTLDRSEEQRTAAGWLIENRAAYDTIFASSGGALPMHYLFQNQQFDEQLVGKFQPGLRIDQLQNISFLPDDCPLLAADDARLLNQHVALLVRASCDQPIWMKQVAVLKFIDQKAAYFVYEPDQALLRQQLSSQVAP